MRCLKCRNSAMTSGDGGRLGDRGGQPGPRLAKIGVGIAQEAVGEIGGMAQRESREIGRGGERGFEQLADLGRLGEKLAAGASSGAP